MGKYERKLSVYFITSYGLLQAITRRVMESILFKSILHVSYSSLVTCNKFKKISFEDQERERNIHDRYRIVQVQWRDNFVVLHHRMDISDPSHHPDVLERSMNCLDTT